MPGAERVGRYPRKRHKRGRQCLYSRTAPPSKIIATSEVRFGSICPSIYGPQLDFAVASSSLRSGTSYGRIRRPSCALRFDGGKRVSWTHHPRQVCFHIVPSFVTGTPTATQAPLSQASPSMDTSHVSPLLPRAFAPYCCHHSPNPSILKRSDL